MRLFITRMKEHVAYKRYKAKEWLIVFVTWHLPRVIVERAAIRLLADATTGAFGGENVSRLGAMDAFKNWDTRTGGDRTNRGRVHSGEA